MGQHVDLEFYSLRIPEPTANAFKELIPQSPLLTVMSTAWLSGNALVSISVVALRQARLVLGWATVCGRVNHLGM